MGHGLEKMIATFLKLVRLGIGHGDLSWTMPEAVNWKRLLRLASRQGLSAVALDGVEAWRKQHPEEKEFPPSSMLVSWVGEVFHNYEWRYDACRRTLGEMASFYTEHGLKMMVLKGFSCGLDWPRPEHRPMGDIDIWLFGEYKRADALLQQEKGIAVDTGHYHHTVFYWGDFMVENHFDFLNLQHHRSNAGIEKVLKELGMDDTRSVEVCGGRVYLPSPNLHALFLLRHGMTHFASSEINLRQLLDWAFFVQAHTAEVDWKWLLSMLDEYGMTRLFHIFNAICVEDLGFEPSIFPPYPVDSDLKARVLRELIVPEFAGAVPTSLLPRAWFKFRRWRANRWKHALCFNESLWSAFWTGVWGHLRNPHSI